jgi:hypothetical protein
MACFYTFRKWGKARDYFKTFSDITVKKELTKIMARLTFKLIIIIGGTGKLINLPLIQWEYW